MHPTATAHRWWALAALGIALICIGLDTTVLSVALPELATELHASTSDLQWFAGAYTLALAAAVIPAGMIGDRYGPKRLLLAALTVFGAASAWCAFAGTPGVLIAARTVLGLAAAVLMPLSMSVITRIFPPAERGKAIAAYATAMAVGLPVGPVLGGYLLEHFWWGSVFLINVPLVALGLVALGWALPPLPGTARTRIDLAGVGFSSAALVLLCYGFIQAGSSGFSAPLVVGLLAGGALSALWFVRHIRRSRAPLVDPKLFRSKGFASGTALATVSTFVMIGALFVLPQYFQAVLGSDSLRTGLQLLPVIGGLVGVCDSFVGWRLVDLGIAGVGGGGWLGGVAGVVAAEGGDAGGAGHGPAHAG